MTLLVESGGAAVYHATWRDLLPIVEAAGGCDTLATDTPYSDKTHAGHDGGTGGANRAAASWHRRDGSLEPGTARRAINYSAWSGDEVREFVAAWSPLTRGWFVSITDHVLAPAWAAALEAAGRYVFSPIACVEPGSRVRLVGDGPSQWSVWAIVARPRSREMQRWGTLPGAYIINDHDPRSSRAIGGKPLSLMRSLVSDYTRPGDLVVDPCCGAGTTLVAARALGRRAIGGDAMLEHAEIAAERIRALPTAADKRGTLALFGSVG